MEQCSTRARSRWLSSRCPRGVAATCDRQWRRPRLERRAVSTFDRATPLGPAIRLCQRTRRSASAGRLAERATSGHHAFVARSQGGPAGSAFHVRSATVGLILVAAACGAATDSSDSATGPMDTASSSLVASVTIVQPTVSPPSVSSPTTETEPSPTAGAGVGHLRLDQRGVLDPDGQFGMYTEGSLGFAVLRTEDGREILVSPAGLEG